jgi:predicted ATP-dependent endonuclease of OLD family
MKIRKTKWKNHPVLGHLELDFTNHANGQPFDTIIFAGENGTGKTSILETLATFLNIGTFEPFEFIDYDVNGQTYKAIPQTDVAKHYTFFDLVNPDGSIRKIRADKSNNRQTISADNLDIRNYGCVFSKARADYKTQQIQSTTTKKLDTDKYDDDNEDDFTSLKQLIVDVENQDNSDYVEINKGLGVVLKTWGDFYVTSKSYRFKSAFDNFFEHLKYDKVMDIGAEKNILFKKNGKSVSIDKLSTGEKQIVFRGIHLLKNSNNLEGAAILIDEPELSMHPKWQRNALKYYKDLYVSGGVQKTQLFFASHSEHVIKEALIDKANNLVIVLWDDGGIIKAKRIDAPSVLPSITAAETNYLAFDIISNDYHIELYGWLQVRQGNLNVKCCDNYIKARLEYIAPLHEKASSHGAITYDTLSTYIRNAIHHPDPARTFNEKELRTSIELLIELCR